MQVDMDRGGDIKHGHAAGIEHRDLSIATPPRFSFGYDLCKRGVHVSSGHSTDCNRVVQVADLRALLEAVDDDASVGEQLRLEVALFRAVGTESGDGWT